MVDQHPQRRLAVFINQRDQFVRRLVKIAGAIGFHRQQRAEARRIAARAASPTGEMLELRQIFLGQIDAAHRQRLPSRRE